MNTKYRLHYAPDNASLIIRLALEELGAGYEPVLVDRAVAAQNSPAYLAINPAGKIPSFETPDGVITETGAILLWLVDTHGRMGAAPDATDRGMFLRWLFFISNTLHPELAMTFYMHRYVADDQIKSARALAVERIVKHLSIIETAAASGAVPGLAQAAPGVLDCYLAPCLRWCALYPKGQTHWFHLDQYPTLKAMMTAFEKRPSAVKAARAEGLGAKPFTAPTYPNPPEGVAL